MKTLDFSKLYPAGKFGKAFGFNGELVLIPDQDHPEDFIASAPKFLFLVLEGLPVPYAVESMREKSGNLIVKLERIDREDSARMLTHTEVLTEQEIEDSGVEDELLGLEGYTVYDETIGKIGVIEEIQEFPLQLIAVCTFQEREVLFPLNENTIMNIDDEARRLDVDLPPGLLDIYLKDE